MEKNKRHNVWSKYFWGFLHVHPKTYSNVNSSIIHNDPKAETTQKCPSTAQWINKIYCIHAMEYYFPIKRHKVLTKLQYRSYEKVKPVTKEHVWFHLYGIPKKNKICRDRKEISCCLRLEMKKDYKLGWVLPLEW